MHDHHTNCAQSPNCAVTVAPFSEAFVLRGPEVVHSSPWLRASRAVGLARCRQSSSTELSFNLKFLRTLIGSSKALCEVRVMGDLGSARTASTRTAQSTTVDRAVEVAVVSLAALLPSSEGLLRYALSSLSCASLFSVSTLRVPCARSGTVEVRPGP